MYKKILVPVDGSGLAECVFEHVKAVATGCNVPEVDLLYVVQPLSRARGGAFAGMGEEFWAQADKKAEALGKDYLAKVAKDMKASGVAAKSTVLRGNPAEKILEYAKKNGVDLIIMSTHGRSGPARWAFGSTTDRVIRLSQAPMMVIRPAACTSPA